MDENILDRKLPFSMIAEQSLLGSILIDPECLNGLTELVSADDFYMVEHKQIFLAMRELYRIMRPGGWGIMVVPEDRGRATTFEDDTITVPAERTRIFGQYDHLRVYGRDYDDRLREAGFEVERIAFAASLTKEERRLYAVGSDDLVVVRRK